MLKCASVYTYEIDNQDAALNEIKTQLESKLTLLENTVGIIMCHPEFIGSGTLRFICSNLPFSIVGVTTAAQAVNGEAGELVLTIFVITSDEARFKTGVAEHIEKDLTMSVKTAYDNISAGETETPRLALIFPPILLQYAGDDYVHVWKEHIPQTPVFGTLAMDDTPTFEENKTIYNGETYKTAIPFVLCYGNINPRFLIGTIPDDKATPHTGEITKSSGSRVREINGINIYKYFESIGLEDKGKSSVNYLFLPFLIDQKKRPDYDGVPVIRVLDSFTDDGTAIFHGNVDEGSTFTIIKCESDDILAETLEKVKQVNAMPDVNGVLLFSCIVRRIVTMDNSSNKEFEIVRDSLRPDIPFMIGCAGGEICPTLIKDGIPTDRYHEYSLVILVL
ncbi:MAG: FIST C-terminal domain-containing protein [Treponema sp.]|nr:FIST C-terminal domain-containing protein [Treponema sp.]